MNWIGSNPPPPDYKPSPPANPPAKRWQVFQPRKNGKAIHTGYVPPTQLDRIEAKLDVLIAALAEDEEQPGMDLEGNPLYGERDPMDPL